jgi:hypothetical protein
MRARGSSCRCRQWRIIARRKLFELADVASKARSCGPRTISQIAFEAVRKFDAFFALEPSSPEARVTTRREDIAPLINDLIDWMKQGRCKLSRHNEVAKAMDCMLKRIDVFTALPRRRPHLPEQQFGRARAARDCSRA